MSIFPEYFGSGSGSGGGKLRFQDFTASGTFTPSALLSLNGGQCFVLCVGGGGGGGTGSSSQGAGGGGGGGAVIVRPLVITSAQTITIGAGGATGAAGSASSIGALLSAPGGGAGANGDPIGIITACTGHTSPELQMGQVFTREQCEDMLYKDLLKHTAVLECVKAPMTDGQKAAFLSFAFNVGNGAFCGSTLARKANAGDMLGACAELSRWTWAGGKQLKGLINRRAAERELCERGLS